MNWSCFWLSFGIFIICGVLSDLPKLNISDPYVITLSQFEPTALIVSCEADNDIKWESNIPQNFTIVRTEKPKKPGGSYVSTFTVDELYSSDTGYLMCIDSAGMTSSSYVYVYNETGEYFLHVHRFSPIAIYATNTSLFLDCATSHPDLNVTFFKETKPIPPDRTSFDPKTGVEITGYSNFMGSYECNYEDKERNTFNVKYIAEKKVPRPHIRDYENSFFVKGEQFFLECSVPKLEDDLVLTWDYPEHFYNKEKKFKVLPTEEGMELVSTLIVEKAELRDSGNYTCTSRLRNKEKTETRTIEVKESIESFIKIMSHDSVITLEENDVCTWVVTVTGYPTNITCEVALPRHSPNETAPKKIRTEFDHKLGRFVLTINRVQASDYGEYTLKVTNGLTNESESLQLIVKAEPAIEFNEFVYDFGIGEEVKMSIPILSHSKVSASWQYYHECQDGIISSPNQCRKKSNKESVMIAPPSKSNRWLSSIAFNTSYPGILYVNAKNDKGNRSAWTHFVINNSNGDFYFHINSETGHHEVQSASQVFEVVEGDSLRIRCGGLSYLYKNILLTAEPIEVYPESSIKDCSTPLYIIWCLNIPNITLNHNGSFTCKPESRMRDSPQPMRAPVAVFGKVSPILHVSSNFTHKRSQLAVKSSQAFFLACNVSGRPKPEITWKKDDVKIQEIPNFFERGVVLKNDMRLEVNYAKPKYAGVYECLATSRAGEMRSSLELTVKAKSVKGLEIIIPIGVIIVIALVSALAVTYRKMNAEKRLRMEFRRNQLYLFSKGNINELNPDCPLDEQADLLPYDDTFEISRDRISLGRVLGSGAFGRVMFGEVDNLECEGTKTKVAVKMCKDSADPTHLRSLTFELKIMQHIGRHLNIVNLLGAHTVNLDKGELWILVEFCQYGQLLQFILRHKAKFVNQVNPDTGFLDFSVHNPISPSIVSDKVPYLAMDSTSDGTQHYDLPSNNMPVGSRKISTVSTGNLEPPVVGISPQKFHFDNPQYRPLGQQPSRESQRSSVSQTWGTRRKPSTISSSGFSQSGVERQQGVDSQGNYFNFEDSIPGVNEPFSTMSCILWAWQVAIGMEYLSSRKVLHSDLAARNLLLAKQNVVKISDFGLSRDMYEKDIYVKKEGDILPIKWMSLEAIQNRQFSTQSDVWAYGITLWEIFTLGKTPYPGVPINNEFVLQLEKGMRLPKPKYATQELYDLMFRCWAEEPGHRPTFSNIASILDNMLNPDARENYMAMNDIHQLHNEEYFGKKTDYLDMIANPDFFYLQCHDLELEDQDHSQETGYLPMTSDIFSPDSSTIFSPRPDTESESKFCFPLSLKISNEEEHLEEISEKESEITAEKEKPTSPTSIQPDPGNDDQIYKNLDPLSDNIVSGIPSQQLSHMDSPKNSDPESDHRNSEPELTSEPLYKNLAEVTAVPSPSEPVHEPLEDSQIKRLSSEHENFEDLKDSSLAQEPIYKNMEQIQEPEQPSDSIYVNL